MSDRKNETLLLMFEFPSLKDMQNRACNKTNIQFAASSRFTEPDKDRQIWSIVGRLGCRSFINKIRVLGVAHQSELTFDDHVSGMVLVYIFHTRALRYVCLLIAKQTVNVIVSIVGSSLDYCNSVFVHHHGSQRQLSVASTELVGSHRLVVHKCHRLHSNSLSAFGRNRHPRNLENKDQFPASTRLNHST